METDELIAALAADATPPKRPKLVVRVVLGAFIAAALMVVFWGVRSDWAAALQTSAVQSKHLYTAILVLGLGILMAKYPIGETKRFLPIWVSLGAIALMWGVSVALGGDPMGQTALSCIASIPLLALPISGLLFAGLRHSVEPFATQRGFLVGLFAGSVSAALYAVHCFEDAPAFFLLWYTLGIILSGVIGRFVGKRLLNV